MPTLLLLLGRPDCHLCEEFEAALQGHLQGGGDIRIDHANVDDRGEWRMRYGRRIPVLLDEAGDVIVETFFDAERFDGWRQA